MYIHTNITYSLPDKRSVLGHHPTMVFRHVRSRLQIMHIIKVFIHHQSGEQFLFIAKMHSLSCMQTPTHAKAQLA